ncbi:MAG TPA: amino acid adenylation domain-containing protein [Candidatus Polarisedimenticolia bacterium]|nr:amino acid adenylation domain-containing protein [Candidatus Polarisedimenticolia bacterium]
MDLTERLAALSPGQRALLEARLKSKGLAPPRPSTIRPIPGRETMAFFPASLDQERLWFIDQMEPGNPAYNIHTATRMIGPMDRERMRRAINLVVARHEVLRTTLPVRDGRPVQVVAPVLELDLPVIDLQHLPPDRREEAAHRAAVDNAAVRFDMERGPLVRVALARLAPEDHVLMICMQHAITDRWSFDVFENEVARLYAGLRDGRPVELPAPVLQFADFAAWQREELSGERLERHLSYWRERLAGAPLVLEIPPDGPRPPVQTFGGARAYIVYPESLLLSLKQLTQKAGATMFMTMLAALDVLCWKHSGQRDLVIGSAIADRNRPELENVLGYFLNMLLLRATIDPAMTFRQLLAQVKETALGAYAHQDVPFATLVSELKPRQDPGRNPLIQVSFIYLDFPILTNPEEAGFAASSLDVDNGASRFDMTLACTELPGTGIHSYIEYNTDLFGRPKVERMLRHLGRILEAAAADPDRRLDALDILTPEESRGRAQARASAARPREEGCLHEPAARRAAESPQAPALVLGGRTVTYGELARASGKIARRLAAAGVGRGDLVPVAALRSVEQAAALLGVLQSGAAYVPLDPSLPQARLRSMLHDAAPRAILVQRETAGSLPGPGDRTVVIEEALADPGSEPAPPRRGSPDDLAYVMFTSGSTGVPKGVMVPHRAILNRILWAQEEWPLGPADRVLHNASFGFDIAAWELFAPLLAGAAVVMPAEGEHKDPGALARLLRDERVTVAHFVPSMLRLVLDEPAALQADSLRAVFCGGEEMDRGLHDLFFRRLPGRTLAHFYGPTEAAISCLSHTCSPGGSGRVPLGRPIANTMVELVDSCMQPVPAGVPGEVVIGGEGIARGYLDRPDRTAERFVPDPISGRPGARIYRTGDLARLREDGLLEFVGRTDHQMKIRGHRIEPGEIERALLHLPGVAGAVAAARGEGDARRLVAYVVPAGEGLPASEQEMRAALRRTLPEPMVPAAIVTLPAFPLGPNGKLDRGALPEPGAARSREEEHVPPRTPAEETIASIWAELLKRDRVGARSDFFELGGDSLLATQAVSRMKAAFCIEFPLRSFFQNSTVEALARAVEAILLESIRSMTDEEAARRLHEAGHALPSG